MRFLRRTQQWALGLGLACMPVAGAYAYDYSLLPPMNGQASDFAERRAGKEVHAAIRIGVTNEGIYRISYSSLTNAGVAASNLVGSMMRLFCRTQEVAILVSSSNAWTASDYFLFPGTGFDGYYSMTNVYWLGFGSGGKRMITRSAAPIAGGTTQMAVPCRALRHRDTLFRSSYRPADDTIDHWVDLFMNQTSSGVVSLVTDRVATNQSAVFQGVLYGYSDVPGVNPDHCTVVSVNGNTIGRFLYDGQATAIVSTSFPSSWLSSTNTFVFKPTLTNGATEDKVYLERFSIDYLRSAVADGNVLFFDGMPGTNNYTVRGFSSGDSLTVLDVSDPWNAVSLTGGQVTNMGVEGYAVAFGVTCVGTARLAVCQFSAVQDVGSVQRRAFRGLVSTNREAEYLVICPYEFRREVYRLLALRHAQGLSVAVAPLPDVYDEFGYGLADAVVIKQFIGYAYHHWRSPPRYVVLAGTGTYDPRHHAFAAPDVIPVYLGPCYDYIPEYNLWTALDNWYACVRKDATNDYYPNVMLGRIPVESAAQLSAVIGKMVAYEAIPTNDMIRSYALLVADKQDVTWGLNFKAASEELRTNAMPGMVVTPVYKDDGGGSNAVVSSINSGQFLVNYFGHGSADVWSSSPEMLTLTNAGGLVNSDYPVVTALTCLNGAFQDPSTCMVEALLCGSHGASACFAASGLTSLVASQSLADGFYQACIGEKRRRVGDALESAYMHLFEKNGNTREALFFVLLGDPAMIVNP